MANYLYNGIELPDINEVWTDKETYPYGFITYSEPHGYLVCIMSFVTLVDYYTAAGENVKGLIASTSGVCSFYRLSDFSVVGAPVRDCYAGQHILPLDIGVFWSNFDILYEDGTVYLAASDPVPVEDEPALPEGDFYRVINGQWVKCDAVRPMVRASSEPVAYKYNGVELPDINEVWTDKTTYPYAVIKKTDHYDTYDVTNLFLLKKIEYFWRDNERYLKLEEEQYYKQYPNSAENWYYVTTNPTGVYVGAIQWASFDIINDDGSVYLPASEPEPVYGSAWVKQDAHCY